MSWCGIGLVISKKSWTVTVPFVKINLMALIKFDFPALFSPIITAKLLKDTVSGS